MLNKTITDYIIEDGFPGNKFENLSDVDIQNYFDKSSGIKWVQLKADLERTPSDMQLEKFFNTISSASEAVTSDQLQDSADFAQQAKLAAIEERDSIDAVRNEAVEPEYKRMLFPREIFPGVLRKFISTISHVRNVPVDYVSCAVLALVNTLGGKNYVYNPTTDLKSHGSLYFALIGSAGSGKSPAISGVLNCVKEIEESLEDKYQKEFIAWKKICNENKQKRKGKKNDEPVEDDPDKPERTTLFVTEATMEARIRLLAHSPHCLQVFDELSALFNVSEYKKTSSDIERYLTIWTGQPMTIDRVSQERIISKNPRLSILGALVPENVDKFASHVATGDGFTDRFLFCCPAPYSGEISLVKSLDTQAVEETTKLFKLWYDENYAPQITDPTKAKAIPIDGGALQLLDEKFKVWMQMARDGRGFSAKYLMHALNLANVLVILWNEKTVTKEIMEKTLLLCEYFLSNILCHVEKLERRAEVSELKRIKKTRQKCIQAGITELTSRQLQRWRMADNAKLCVILLKSMADYDFGALSKDGKTLTLSQNFLNPNYDYKLWE